MKGTEKQIQWAEDIKANAISNLRNNIERMSAEPRFEANVKAQKLMLAVLDVLFSRMDDASKIIDFREKFAPSHLFRTCDRWAELLDTGRATITEIAAREGLKDYKEC